MKKSESVTILSSNLSRGYLVHRPPTSQVPPQVPSLSPPGGRHLVHHRVEKLQTMDVSSHQKLMPRHVVRALQQKAGSLPTVSTSLAPRQENLRLGLSGSHFFSCNILFGEEETSKLASYRIRKQSFSRQGRGGEAPVDSGFW